MRQNRPIGVGRVIAEAIPTADSRSALHMDHAKKGLAPKPRAVRADGRSADGRRKLSDGGLTAPLPKV